MNFNWFGMDMGMRSMPTTTGHGLVRIHRAEILGADITVMTSAGGWRDKDDLDLTAEDIDDMHAAGEPVDPTGPPDEG